MIIIIIAIIYHITTATPQAALVVHMCGRDDTRIYNINFLFTGGACELVIHCCLELVRELIMHTYIQKPCIDVRELRFTDYGLTYREFSVHGD